MTSSREWLVVLEAESASAAVAGLRAVAEVRHVALPRLAVVAAADPTAVRAVPGVLDVLASVPESLLRSLDPDQALVARAFQRRQDVRGPRPGEGLAWDAPGFEPPDDPTQR